MPRRCRSYLRLKRSQPTLLESPRHFVIGFVQRRPYVTMRPARDNVYEHSHPATILLTRGRVSVAELNTQEEHQPLR